MVGGVTLGPAAAAAAGFDASPAAGVEGRSKEAVAAATAAYSQAAPQLALLQKQAQAASADAAKRAAPQLEGSKTGKLDGTAFWDEISFADGELSTPTRPRTPLIRGLARRSRAYHG